MKAAVLGAGGLLGRHLVEELVRAGHIPYAFDHAACRVDDAVSVQHALASPVDVVFNCAAFTDVDGAETAPNRAFSVNALGAENVARTAASSGAVVVHVSTDFVFAGTLNRPYHELDEPNPRSVYGRSKLEGELLVKRATARHHIVRVQALYGAGGRNFASRLAHLILDGRSLRLDGERCVQPTWARTAARALIEIANSDQFGTWHAACGGSTTWHGFASRLADKLGVARRWTTVSSSRLALAAQRPANCLMVNRRLDLSGLLPLPRWEVALDGALDELRLAMRRSSR